MGFVSTNPFSQSPPLIISIEIGVKMGKDELIAGYDRLTGAFVSTLESREFVVVGAENREVQDLDNKDKMKKKCILTVEIDGEKMEWFANKTSLDFITKVQKGFKLSNLVGFKGEFITLKKDVYGKMLDVIYVKGSIEE